MTEGLEAAMEEFDIREATPEDAEKIIAYLAQVGGETDYLSFGKEGLPISTEEEEKFIQNINKEEHSVLYVVWKNGEIIGDASLSGFSRRMSHRAEFGISVVKSEWGQGIGSALLQKCNRFCYKCSWRYALYKGKAWRLQWIFP